MTFEVLKNQFSRDRRAAVMSWHTGLEWIGAWRELPGQMLEEISALGMGVRGVGAGSPWDLPGVAQHFSAEENSS